MRQCALEGRVARPPASGLFPERWPRIGIRRRGEPGSHRPAVFRAIVPRHALFREMRGRPTGYAGAVGNLRPDPTRDAGLAAMGVRRPAEAVNPCGKRWDVSIGYRRAWKARRTERDGLGCPPHRAGPWLFGGLPPRGLRNGPGCAKLWDRGRAGPAYVPSVPLVLGTPGIRGSGSTAIRRARATALKIASLM